MPTPKPLAIAAAIATLLAVSGPATPSEKPARVPGAEKVQVSLVLIDVVVRDRKDRPIPGLTRNDFELLVDRRPTVPSDMETFEEVCPSGPATASIAAASPSAVPPAPASPQAAVPAGAPRTIVLYIDFSQLSLSGRRQALIAARDHVAAHVGPNDRVMILAFKKGLRLVQDFTGDGKLLASRLDEMIPDTSTMEGEVLDEDQNLRDVATRGCDVTGTSCLAARTLAANYATMEEMRALRSLHALESLMPSLAGIKGRKALVLFTDVLRDEPGVQYARLANVTAKDIGSNLEPELLRLTQEANAAGVSIYTVHASGLDDRSLEGFRDAKPDTVRGSSSTRVTPEGADGAGKTYEAARVGLDSALAIQTTMATETGGHALQRTNDIGSIVETAQQDLSCYYLIGYRYQGHGDNMQHSILVKLRPDANGDQRRGVTLRYRPYYTDISPDARRERLERSAIEAPDLFRKLPIATEAFALAPDKSKRRVLIKATVPIDALSLIPSGDTALEGHAVLRGEVNASNGSGAPVCSFEQDLPLKVPRQPETTKLVFETGCLLGPGSYELAITVFDPTTQEIGARRSGLVVQAAEKAGQPFVSDVSLWTREQGAYVVSAGAEAIGLKASSSAKAFAPRAERRLARGQEALMSFLFCPAAGTAPAAGSGFRVHRTLLGEGDAEVASFRDLTITDPPDADTGCYQIFSTIPANTLGDGVYRFNIQLAGPMIGAPISREADLMVD